MEEKKGIYIIFATVKNYLIKRKEKRSEQEKKRSGW